MKKYLVIIFFSAISLLVLYFYQSTKFSDKALHLVFCDVGQGDGILIRTPEGTDIVIDGGPKNGKMLKCLEEHMPFWDRDIELMFATHPDADHIGGLVEILQNYNVLAFNRSAGRSETIIFNTLERLVSENKIPDKVIVAGNKFSTPDQVLLETLWPNPGFKSSETNEYSLVQVLKYGNFRALLTGDVTYQILDTLTFPESFQVFKIPHHGSKTGIDDVSLQKIKTYFVPISAGYKNRYHHPHPSVLGLLKKYDIPYERTDQVGTIEIVTDGKNTKILN